MVDETQIDATNDLLARIAVALETVNAKLEVPWYAADGDGLHDIKAITFGGQTLRAVGHRGFAPYLVVAVKKLREGAVLPVRKTDEAAGYDLALPTDIPTVVVAPGEKVTIGTGFSTAFPAGWFARIAPRSSLREYVMDGIIDSDYRKEWGIILHNPTQEAVSFKPGERVAQVVVHEAITQYWAEVGDLPPSNREGGFGSTGR